MTDKIVWNVRINLASSPQEPHRSLVGSSLVLMLNPNAVLPDVPFCPARMKRSEVPVAFALCNKVAVTRTTGIPSMRLHARYHVRPVAALPLFAVDTAHQGNSFSDLFVLACILVLYC